MNKKIIILSIFLLLIPFIVKAQIESPAVAPSHITITNATPGETIRMYLDLGNRNTYATKITLKIDGNNSNWIVFDNTSFMFEAKNSASTNYWDDRAYFNITIPPKCQKNQTDWAELVIPPATKFGVTNYIPYTPCVFEGKWYGNTTFYTEGPYAGQGKWQTLIEVATEPNGTVGQVGISVAAGIPLEIYIAQPSFWEQYSSILIPAIIIVIIAIILIVGYHYWKRPLPTTTEQQLLD
jgi:hypothetical protein